jgi:uncharacterized membrane protein YhaH (DUF805 family)
MTSLEDIWSSKPDAQVQKAATCLDEYSVEAQSAILGEVTRRRLMVGEAVAARPQLTVVQSYVRGWKQFAVFRERAGRKECFTFLAGNLVLVIALLIVGDFSRGAMLAAVVLFFAVQLPQHAVFVRRFHDAGKSAWWLLVELIPFVGWVCLLALLLQSGEAGPNQWGDPT